jgi:hypothetical protein
MLVNPSVVHGCVRVLFQPGSDLLWAPILSDLLIDLHPYLCRDVFGVHFSVSLLGKAMYLFGSIKLVDLDCAAVLG